MNLGEVVDGRFAIESHAGSGGMAEVYRAQDRATGEPVALKLLFRHAAPEVARFEREATLLGQLEHPNIVRYVGQGITHDGRPYLVMEWLEGTSLSERLRQGPVDVAEAVDLGRQAALALKAAHSRGVVHRDLKPSNLFLIDGTTDRVKLIDFGIAGVRGAARTLTATGVMIGSPGYMAPEQVRGERVDPRADVFALGCVLFKCLTGRRAFEGQILEILAKIVADPAPRISDVCDGVPAELVELISRLMAKAPRDRPPDGAAVAAELDALGEIGAAQSRPRPPVGLTRAERRLVCVLLVQAPEGTCLDTLRRSATAAAEPRPNDGQTISIDQTAATVPEEGIRGPLRLVLARHGGSIEACADGSLLIAVQGSSSASDQLERAARCALSVREAIGEMPMALVAGRDETTTGTGMSVLRRRAGRLCEPAQGTAVRVDDVVAGLLDAKFELSGDEHGLFLVGERQVTAPSRTLLGKTTPCVGREHVLSTLNNVLYECISEPVARSVLITADAGMGKSRVLQELIAPLRDEAEPTEAWMASGDAMSSSTSFVLLAQIIRSMASIHEGEPLELKRRKLAARLARHLPERDRQRVTEFLGEIAGAPFDETDSVPLREARCDPMLMSDQRRRAWIDLLDAESRAQPVMLILDNLQWGDLPTVELVDAALRDLPDRPLMVLAAGRPSVHERFPALWAKRAVTEIHLPRLTKRASESLVRAVLGSGVDEVTEGRLVERAAGNAFYLEELIRGVARGEVDTLPDSVLAMSQGRLEQLDPEARLVLRAASVFGESFWPPALLVLLGRDMSASRLDEWLAALVDEEVLARTSRGALPGMTEYRFRQALVREAAYAMLTEEDRILGHRLAGTWLEQIGGAAPARLASHFQRGGALEQAATWYERAADHALEGNDPEASLAHASAGMTCGARGEMAGRLQLIMARTHYWAGSFSLAQQHAAHALERLPAGGALWINAVRHAAQSCAKLGETDRLERYGTMLLDQTPLREHQTSYLGALAACAIELLFAGRREPSGALLARLDEHDQTLAAERPTIQAAVHAARAFHRLYAGDLGGYLDGVLQVVLCDEQAGDVRSASLYRINVAYALIELGAYERAEETLQQALATARRTGLARLVPLAHNNLAVALTHLGRLDEARSAAEQAVAAYHDSGNRRMEGGTKSHLAATLAEQGQLEAAADQALEAIELLEVAPPLQAQAYGTLASVRLRQGDVAGAWDAADHARKLLHELGDIEDGESLVRVMVAETLNASGRHAEACAAIREARDRLLERASKLTAPEQRESFLNRVADNARTLELWKSWCG